MNKGMTIKLSRFKLFYLLTVVSLLAGCSSGPVSIKDSAPTKIPVDISSIPDAIPRYEPYSKHANPESYTVWGKRYKVMRSGKGYQERGISSWYGTKFHGKKTANGETYDMFAMTAAHKTLPLPSYVKVTNLKNGRSVVVRVNDRGPFHGNRIIDLSYAAAIKLGIHKTGTGFVEVRTVEPGQNDSNSHKTESKERIFLQVGAFKNKANAVTLKNKLRSMQSVNSRIQRMSTGNGQLVYKLQLGPISSVNEADKLMFHLSKLGISNSHFVTEAIAQTPKHVTIATE